MPVSGLVIRLAPEAEPVHARSELGRIALLELGEATTGAFAAVLAGPDYAAHDAALTELERHALVAAIDVVFHDFSDVTTFDRPRPGRRKAED